MSSLVEIPLSGPVNWYNPIAAPNGKIYGCADDGATSVAFDPADDSAVTITHAHDDYWGEKDVLAPNGCIYSIPYYNGKLRIIDTTTDTVSLVPLPPAFVASSAWTDGSIVMVLADPV